MVTKTANIKLQDDLDDLAERYADSALGSLPHTSEEDVRDGLAGSYLRFLQDALSLG